MVSKLPIIWKQTVRVSTPSRLDEDQDVETVSAEGPFAGGAFARGRSKQTYRQARAVSFVAPPAGSPVVRTASPVLLEDDHEAETVEKEEEEGPEPKPMSLVARSPSPVGSEGSNGSECDCLIHDLLTLSPFFWLSFVCACGVEDAVLLADSSEC